MWLMYDTFYTCYRLLLVCQLFNYKKITGKWSVPQKYLVYAAKLVVKGLLSW